MYNLYEGLGLYLLEWTSIKVSWQTDARPQRPLSRKVQSLSHAAANYPTFHNYRWSCWNVLTEMFIHGISGVTCEMSYVVLSYFVLKSKYSFTCINYLFSVLSAAVQTQHFTVALRCFSNRESCSCLMRFIKMFHFQRSSQVSVPKDDQISWDRRDSHLCTVFISLNKTIVLFNYTACPFARLPELGSITA